MNTFTFVTVQLQYFCTIAKCKNVHLHFLLMEYYLFSSTTGPPLFNTALTSNQHPNYTCEDKQLLSPTGDSVGMDH